MTDVRYRSAFSRRLGTDRTGAESVMECAQPVTEIAMLGSVGLGALRGPQRVVRRVVVERYRFVVSIGDVPPIRRAQKHHGRDGHGKGPQNPSGSSKGAKHPAPR